MRGRCLSWVKSRYWPMSKVSLLYPQQQTFQIQHYAHEIRPTKTRPSADLPFVHYIPQRNAGV